MAEKALQARLGAKAIHGSGEIHDPEILGRPERIERQSLTVLYQVLSMGRLARTETINVKVRRT